MSPTQTGGECTAKVSKPGEPLEYCERSPTLAQGLCAGHHRRYLRGLPVNVPLRSWSKDEKTLVVFRLSKSEAKALRLHALAEDVSANDFARKVVTLWLAEHADGEAPRKVVPIGHKKGG
jgi:hypothetical protein